MKGLDSKEKALAQGLVEAIADGLVEQLADALADRDEFARRVAAHLVHAAAPDDGWLDAREAAKYLGLTLDALYKLSAAHAIPCEQAGANCKLWFKRCELDQWRKTGEPRVPRSVKS